MQYQINCNTKATIVILSHKEIVKTHYEKVSFKLAMYALLNQAACFIFSKLFIR